jgi:hypothetical protein
MQLELGPGVERFKALLDAAGTAMEEAEGREGQCKRRRRIRAEEPQGLLVLAEAAELRGLHTHAIKRMTSTTRAKRTRRRRTSF